MITTAGKLMLQEALPEKYHAYLDDMDGGRMAAMFTQIAREDPDKYQDLLHKVEQISQEAITTYGTEASLSLEDMQLPEELKPYKARARQQVREIINMPIPSAEKNARIVATMTKLSAEIPDRVLESASKQNNALALQVRSGARGGKNSLMQMLFGDVLLLDAKDNPVPIPGLHSYGEGLTPLEYWASSSGARKGAVDKQFATANSGYLAKNISNIGHRTVVTEEDCNTINGLAVAAHDPDNIGSVLARPAGALPAGTLITKENMGKLGSKPIVLRSTMTCQAENGICSICAGMRENNDFPHEGDVVGLVAARAMTEPITQSALRSKHAAGVASDVSGDISGFEEMNQFLQVPELFRGGAVLADTDGQITDVSDAPGGGSNVHMNNKVFYVPKGRRVEVKRGDRVLAGDALSDGVPNPAEVTAHKGIGEGRRYFVEKFYDLLKKNKAQVHRRNVEALARGFINRIEVTDPEGFQGYMVGDVVPYDDIVRRYEPRTGSVETRTGQARDGYLEKPVLHYSIGTRVTPNVVKTLSEHGIDSILIHKQQPPFRPIVVKARDILESDPDWMTRLGGENLRRAALESAAMGASSEKRGTSYFPAAADPAALGSAADRRPIK